MVYLLLAILILTIIEMYNRQNDPNAKLRFGMNGNQCLVFEAVVKGKYYQLNYEHIGGGSCSIIAMLQSDYIVREHETTDLSYLFLFDDNGKVIDSIKGINAFTSDVTEEWLAIVKKIERFWAERELYK